MKKINLSTRISEEVCTLPTVSLIHDISKRRGTIWEIWASRFLIKELLPLFFLHLSHCPMYETFPGNLVKVNKKIKVANLPMFISSFLCSKVFDLKVLLLIKIREDYFYCKS